jgi:hypothetical protein
MGIEATMKIERFSFNFHGRYAALESADSKII